MSWSAPPLAKSIDQPPKRTQWIGKLLERQYWPWMAGMTALLFSLVACPNGFQLDDFYHQAILRGELKLGTGSPLLDVFTWSIGDPVRNQLDRDRGLLPWWTSDSFRMKFFRPLAAATHLVDQNFWPQQKWLMHLHSSAWLAATVVVVCFLFRRLFTLADNPSAVSTEPAATQSPAAGTWTNMAAAGLAGLIYALRDEHAITVAWIANRNLLMMTFFGCLTWLLHCVWRESRSVAAAIAAPVCFAVALLCGESAVAIGGCLFAYAVVLDSTTWRGKFLSLLPCGLVGLAWLVMYRILECGAVESGSYLDPRSDLLAFLVGMAQRAPVYFASSLGLMSATISTFSDVTTRHLMVLASVLMTVAIAVIVWPAIRQDRLLQFFAICLIIAVVPLCAGLATDRLTMIFNIPASGLIARFVQLKRNDSNILPTGERYQWYARRLAKLWIVLHTIIAAILLPTLIVGFGVSGSDLMVSARSASFNHPGFAKQDLILLNAPHGMYPLYMDLARLDEGLVRARTTRLLSSALSPFEVSRPDENTLEISVPERLLNDPFSTLYRNPERQPFRAGQRIELPRFMVNILETQNGHPTRVAYQFQVPLEDPSLCIVEWRDNKYVPFVPPPVGTSRQIPRACDWSIFHLNPLSRVCSERHPR
ncbi:MAG: hypothetical protein WCJ09_06965 [Planctomycetota bacterium]